MSADTPRRLGRGLEALISTAKQQRDAGANAVQTETPRESDLKQIPVADIIPNRFQPRRVFSEPELAELEASIKANGLLQPIVVRVAPNAKWELVAGERRLRAVTRLGWTEIPVVVRDFDDRAMLTLALVENLQRADLNPLEEAEGFQRLIDEFGLTQQQVADAVGKDRTSITNLLRILTLQAAVKQLVARGSISAGHARALLPIKDDLRQLELANEIVARQLSVREVEARARALTTESAPPAPTPASPTSVASAGATNSTDLATKRIEEQLRKHLQTDVHIQTLGNDRGVVRINFYSPDDLERLLDLVIGPSRSDFD
jgi:ParB family transcriptional regulator, chromosome partitioning protein